MMRYEVLTSILFVFLTTQQCNGLGISSKLDFGERRTTLIETAIHPKSVPIPYRHSKREENKSGGDFEGVGVVCTSTSGECITIKSNQSTDSIQADVVVHVKTTVDLNKNNKTNFVDNTPDVPVIVGTAGTDSEDDSSRTYKQPLVLSAVDEIFSSANPSITPSFDTFPSSLQPDNLYVQNDGPQVDIKIKTLPSVALAVSDEVRNIKGTAYKTNGIELRVPYFEPSYHNHYFGENPPPQLAFYPKNVGLQYRPKWKPSFWNGNTHKHHVNSGTCSCKNQPNTGGLQWHSARRIYTEDPGSQINDKLGPLN